MTISENPTSIEESVNPMAFIERARQFQKEADRITHANQPLLIGLGGYYQHGKDAVADYLTSAHGYTKLGMSDVLASVLYAQNPWIRVSTREEADMLTGAGLFLHHGAFVKYQRIVDAIGYTKAKEIKEVREALQLLGTEAGRKILGENIWADTVAKRIQALRIEGHPVAITGIRYHNEIAMIRKLGGTAVWVHRSGMPAPDLSHTSEATLVEEDFDYTVHNSGTLRDLHSAADTMISFLDSLLEA